MPAFGCCRNNEGWPRQCWLFTLDNTPSCVPVDHPSDYFCFVPGFSLLLLRTEKNMHCHPFRWTQSFAVAHLYWPSIFHIEDNREISQSNVLRHFWLCILSLWLLRYQITYKFSCQQIKHDVLRPLSGPITHITLHTWPFAVDRFLKGRL